MNKISLDLANCYGIKNLKHTFDFSQEAAFALYAPNGSMKSSLARTFQDVARSTATVDRIFPARPTTRTITDEAGTAVQPAAVFVVIPYDADYGPSAKTSTLLVNPTLKKKHDELLASVEKAKGDLLAALKAQSKSKRNIEQELSLVVIGADDADAFIRALTRLLPEVEAQAEAPFTDLDYDLLFHDNVLDFFGKNNAKTAVEAYVKRYNELLAASMYFKKGIFDYYGAAQIADALTKHGFFSAKHTVNLKSTGKTVEVNTKKELEQIIDDEKRAILTDATLKKQFEALQSALDKNIPLRAFREYLSDHETLVPHMANIRTFKEGVWKSYLKANMDLYRDLMNQFSSVSAELAVIDAQAKAESTQWQEVIKIFNSRFVVPFTLEVDNKVAVMLDEEPIRLAFEYHDGAEHAPVERTKLLDVLSTGERKALYILNIIFEVEVRRKGGQETLLVIDDLADSFDYQNKYAIIQYLRDINEDKLFKQLIMTHNFDFFRTIRSRFVRREHCLMASKTAVGISLEQAIGIRNVFVEQWKANFFTNDRQKIASIPFIRNIVEYTRGHSDPDFARLTSLLHWKTDTAGITIGDVDAVFNRMFTPNGASPAGATPVLTVIEREANACLSAPTGINLENKIVLAIAVRLSAERFMTKRIANPAFLAAIRSHQTPKLLSEFKRLFPGDTDSITVLDGVVLMTPENIHLNSFMYEPIIDMSDDRLRSLYREVLALK